MFYKQKTNETKEKLSKLFSGPSTHLPDNIVRKNTQVCKTPLTKDSTLILQVCDSSIIH